MKYIKPKRISLKNHPTLNERWVQDRIAEDPSILGLGDDLEVRDRERRQPSGGRLDLLLEDVESDQRYEVEIQLGSTDESHIIRTIEYYDVERRRFPQYEHCAVLIAEDITSRFLNVISLFNGFIPLIAIQMAALQIDDQIILVFTRVMDQLSLGPEDETAPQPADRAYWENKATKTTVGMADDILAIVRAFDPALGLKYNKHYIGLAKNNIANNFAIFRPKKEHLRVEIRLKPSDEVQQQLDDSNLDVMNYDKRWGRCRIRLTKGDVEKHKELLTTLLRRAYDESGGE